MTEDNYLEHKLREGLELFNKQEFFECHEVLEDCWKLQHDPEKQLTQGIIQVAVAYYHGLRGNSIGALKLFERGLARIEPFAPNHGTIALDTFLKQARQDRDAIAAGKPPSDLVIAKIAFAGDDAVR